MTKSTSFHRTWRLNCRGRLIEFSGPVVMGILNLTPDSFYSGSRMDSLDAALMQADQMIKEGAAILDIGGYSTRPGADDVPVGEELERVIPVIEALRKRSPEVLLSIDTFRQKVAMEARDAGADIVNDVSGGELDEAMLDWVGNQHDMPYIMMHMRGNPKTMKGLDEYKDLVPEVIRELWPPFERLRKQGKTDIIIDPGFGFAKNIEQNFEMLGKLNEFSLFKAPILVGLSRKSMIYRTLGIEAKEALAGTISLNTVALLKGADILRVHDVREAVQTIELLKMLP